MPHVSAETRLFLGAAVAGLIHAAFSLYWALGGTWLLRTVGQWAVEYAQEGSLAVVIVLGCVAAVKCLFAIGPVVASRHRLRHPGRWRGLALLAA